MNEEKEHRGLLDASVRMAKRHIADVHRNRRHRHCAFCWLNAHPDADVRHGLGVVNGGRLPTRATQKNPEAEGRETPSAGEGT